MRSFLNSEIQTKVISSKQESVANTIYDFSSLKKHLDNKRVVMLGEPDHGDSASFAIKVELVKYLHLNCGFNIFAIEADFFALNRAWTQATSSEEVLNLSQYVYSFWAKDKSMQSLWGFFAERFESSSPLVVSGFDIRHSRRFASEIITDLEKIIEQYNIVVPEAFDQFQIILSELLNKEYNHAVTGLERQTFFLCLTELQKLFKEQVHRNSELEFWLQELKNLEYTAKNAWSFEYRDIGMAKNIAWLLSKRYPNEKIIVWAHNYHIAKDSQEIADNSESFYEQINTFPDTLMGDVLKQELGEDLYSLALISGGGQYNHKAYQANYEDITEVNVSDSSIGKHLNKVEGDILFLDLDQQESKFSMSGLAHNNELNLQWSKVFDGLIHYATSSGIEV